MSNTVESIISEAKNARTHLSRMNQEQLDRIAKAICDQGFAAAEELSIAAVEETKMGRVASKVQKHFLATKEVWNYAKDIPTTGILKRDEINGLMEIAVPKGIVAAILPVTNPTTTVLFKSIIALKTGNPIIFSPSRRARLCCQRAVEIAREAAQSAGAPVGAIALLDGDKEDALQLISHPDVGVILATGGMAMARAAYSSGNPAIGVGAANVPAYIHRSAKLSQAAGLIIESQGFDWGLVCASEQNLVVDAEIADSFLHELTSQGAHFCNANEVQMLAELLAEREGLHAVLGQSPATIAQLAGFAVAENTRLLIAPQSGVGSNYSISQEKLAPILGWYVANDEAHAESLCLEIINFGGLGHTFAIHAEDRLVIERFSLLIPASRIIVNAASSLGGVGQSTNLIPSLTLGCGAIGKNALSTNVNVLDLIDIKRVAWGKSV